MAGLIYTVETETEDGLQTQTFEGFCTAAALCLDHGCHFLKVKDSQRPPEAKYLGVVTWEDTVVLYWLENDKLAVEEIQRMWRMAPGVEVEVFVYERKK